MGRPPKNRPPADAGAADQGDDTAGHRPDDIEGDDAEVSFQQIQELLSSADMANASVQIYRKAPKGDRFDYCTEMDVTEFDYETVKKMYGGGDYKMRLLDQNRRYVKQRRFSIDPRFKGSVGAEPAPSAAGLADNPFLAQLMSMQSENTKLVMAMMAESQRSMATIIAAIAGRPALAEGGGLKLKDILELMPHLVGQKKAQEMGPREMMTFFREMRDLIGDEKPSDKGGLLEMLESLAPMVMARLSGQPLPHALPAAEPHQAEGAGADQAAGARVEKRVSVEEAAAAERDGARGPGKAPVTPQESDMDRVLRLCLRAASLNSDAALYSEMVLDTLPDDAIDQVKNVLAQPDWIATFFAGFEVPEASKPWLENMKGLLLKALDEVSAIPMPGGESHPPGVQSAGGAPGAN